MGKSENDIVSEELVNYMKERCGSYLAEFQMKYPGKKLNITFEEDFLRDLEDKVDIEIEDFLKVKRFIIHKSDMIYKHIEALEKNRKLKTYIDDYGKLRDNGWNTEKEYFYDFIIGKPELNNFDFKEDRSETIEEIDKYVNDFEVNPEDFK